MVTSGCILYLNCMKCIKASFWIDAFPSVWFLIKMWPQFQTIQNMWVPPWLGSRAVKIGKWQNLLGRHLKHPRGLKLHRQRSRATTILSRFSVEQSNAVRRLPTARDQKALCKSGGDPPKDMTRLTKKLFRRAGSGAIRHKDSYVRPSKAFFVVQSHHILIRV